MVCKVIRIVEMFPCDCQVLDINLRIFRKFFLYRTLSPYLTFEHKGEMQPQEAVCWSMYYFLWAHYDSQIHVPYSERLVLMTFSFNKRPGILLSAIPHLRFHLIMIINRANWAVSPCSDQYNGKAAARGQHQTLPFPLKENNHKCFLQQYWLYSIPTVLISKGH